jgi:hypothetical protein
MSRTDQRRRRVLRAVAPVAGLLAVGLLVWQGSYAAFSAQTNNTNNAWATGSLTLTNDGGTGSYATTPFNTAGLFAETTIKPGDTKTHCLTVKTGGTSGGNLVFYRGAVGGSAPLSAQIGLTIVAAPASTTDLGVTAACANFPGSGTTTLATNVALSALPSTYGTGLGPVAITTGVKFVAYKFVYTFNSLGTNPLDNALQGTNTNSDFSWEIQ